MSGKSNISVLVSFRIPIEARDKILAALDSPTNATASIGEYARQWTLRAAYRHDKNPPAFVNRGANVQHKIKEPEAGYAGITGTGV
jgi:hypothetical protein